MILIKFYNLECNVLRNVHNKSHFQLKISFHLEPAFYIEEKKMYGVSRKQLSRLSRNLTIKKFKALKLISQLQFLEKNLFSE